jgi:hypothetical protein
MIELGRRGFIGGALALIAAPAIVKASSLMKVAPTEIISLDPWSNSYLSVQEIVRESVRQFRNSNAFVRAMQEQYREDYEFMAGNAENDWQWPDVGGKIGTQLRIRLPADFTVTDGPGLSVQDTVEQQAYVSLAGRMRPVTKDEFLARWPDCPEPVIPSSLALAAAAVAVVAPEVLKVPVTRRFWK